MNSRDANNARLKKAELPAAIHLAFDELQRGDLSFRLAVRPGRRDRGSNIRGCRSANGLDADWRGKPLT